MTLITRITIALALVASVFAQETELQKKDRLAELRANNARFQQQQQAKPVSEAVMAPQAISLSVKSPIFASVGTSIKWFADVNNDGRSDLAGTFWTAKDGGITSLASFGSYLYGHDGRSSILRFTDVGNNGVADGEPAEVFAGATFTNRLLPYAIDRMYAEDNGRPRLVKYSVGVGQATAFSQNLPVIGNSWVTGTVLSNELRKIFTVDQNNNVVRSFVLNADNTVGEGKVEFTGKRITNIAVDGKSGVLLVLQAGECFTGPNPPSLPGAANESAQQPTICSSSIITLVRLNSFVPGTREQQLAVGGWMFNIEYGSYLSLIHI